MLRSLQMRTYPDIEHDDLLMLESPGKCIYEMWLEGCGWHVIAEIWGYSKDLTKVLARTYAEGANLYWPEPNIGNRINLTEGLDKDLESEPKRVREPAYLEIEPNLDPEDGPTPWPSPSPLLEVTSPDYKAKRVRSKEKTKRQRKVYTRQTRTTKSRIKARWDREILIEIRKTRSKELKRMGRRLKVVPKSPPWRPPKKKIKRKGHSATAWTNQAGENGEWHWKYLVYSRGLLQIEGFIWLKEDEVLATLQSMLDCL